MSSQRSFLPPPRTEHGGEILRGKRKSARPIDPKRALHTTLCSTRARGNWSMLHPRNKARVHVIIHDAAERFGLRIFRFANVGNHVHLLVKTPSRRAFQNFMRVISGAIALAITGACRGNPQGKFWDQIAYSRIVNWGRDFVGVLDYLVKNLLEGLGICGVIPRSIRWNIRAGHSGTPKHRPEAEFSGSLFPKSGAP